MAAAPTSTTSAEPIERVMALSVSTHHALFDFLDSINIKLLINITREHDVDNATITNQVHNAPKEELNVPHGDTGVTAEVVYTMLASGST